MFGKQTTWSSFPPSIWFSGAPIGQTHRVMELPKEYIAVTFWFSMLGQGGGNFVCRDIFVCHNSGRKGRGANGFQWVKARHFAKLPPITKKYLIQNITSAKCEKPWCSSYTLSSQSKSRVERVYKEEEGRNQHTSQKKPIKIANMRRDSTKNIEVSKIWL